MADYTTYARIVLSNSKIISELINKYAYPKQSTKAGGFGLPYILTQEQIQSALEYPLHSIQAGINAYIATLHSQIDLLNAEGQIEQALKDLTSDLKTLRTRHGQ